MTSEVDGISPSAPTLQQGRRKRLSGATRQSSAPTPHHAFLAARVLNVPSRAPSASGMIGLLRPPSSYLAREHHQSSLALFTCQFRMRAFFRAAGLVPGGSVPFCTLPPGGSVSSHCADHRGVYGNLCAVEQRQTVGDHFQTAVICSRPWMEIQVLDTNVDRHPGTCLSADSCSKTSSGNPRRPRTPA